MASKYTRKQVGSIYVSKNEGQSDYLEFRLPPGETLVFKDGDKLQIESKRYKAENLERGRVEGRVGDETYAKVKKYIDGIPEFVRAEVVILKKNS